MRKEFDKEYCNVDDAVHDALNFVGDGELGVEYYFGEFLSYYHICRCCASCGSEFYGYLAEKNKENSEIMKIVRENNQEFSRLTPISGSQMLQGCWKLQEIDENGRALASKIKELEFCPVCGGRLLPEFELTGEEIKGYILERPNSNGRERFEYYELDKEFNKEFNEMREIRLKAFLRNARDQAEKYIENCDDELPPSTYGGSSKIIKADSDKLSSYLTNVLNIESGIYAAKTILERLYNSRHVCHMNSTDSKATLLESANKKLMLKQSEYNRVKDENIAKGIALNVAKIPAPQKPTKPSFNMVMPEEPTYQTPGLFNKKKVEAANDKLRQEYEHSLAVYELKCNQYNEAKATYDEEINKYQIACEEHKQLQKEKDEEAKREYHLRLVAATEAHDKKLATAKNEVVQIQNEIQSLMNGGAASAESFFIDEEIKKTEGLLAELVKCRSQLYSTNVVYPKYRNMVAIASFCDYIASGRCESLEGPSGAYNKYEEEIRAELVINKLSEIVNSLDAIKDNQYILYCQMSAINKNLTNIGNTMEKALKSIEESIDSAAGTIDARMKNLVDNSAVIAYNTAVNAYYAKKNAELTNALGFLVALK